MNFRTLTGLVAGAAAAVSIGATPALADNTWIQANDSVFSGCDGYGMPASGGDGMTTRATMGGFLNFNPPGYGTTAKVDIGGRGAQGVMACDAALSASQLRPSQWLRKVNLLQARALHQLEQNNYAAALADIALARGAVQTPDDLFYARSLGVSLDLVEGYARRKSGDQAGAQPLYVRALTLRPYNRQVAASAYISMGREASQEARFEAMRAAARLDPTFIDSLFRSAVIEGRWADVIAFYPKGGLTTNGDGATVEPQGSYGLAKMGAYAYALATTGNRVEADKVIADARAVASVRMAPKDLVTVGKGAYSGTAITEVPKASTLVSKDMAMVEEWATLVTERLLVEEGKVDLALEMMRKNGLSRGPHTVDLLNAIIARTPPKDTALISQLKSARTKFTDDRPSGPEIGVEELFDTLPKAEIASSLPRYKPAKNNFFSYDQDGFVVTPVKGVDPATAGGEAVSISFRGKQANAAVVEEMALLRAADMARQSGKKGFIILSRSDTRNMITSMYLGVPTRTDPNGFSTTISVIFVDPQALPEQYRTAAWRVIDADALYGAFAPIYIKAGDRR